MDHPLRTATSMFYPTLTFAPDGTLLFAGVADTSAFFYPAAAGAEARSALSVFVYRSVDGGRTLREPTIIAPGQGLWYAAGPVGLVGSSAVVNDHPWIRTGSGNNVLLAWVRSTQGPSAAVCGAGNCYGTYASTKAIVVAMTHDGGSTWSEPIAAVRCDCDYPRPALVGPETVVVAYVDYSTFQFPTPTSTYHAGLAIARSTDGGKKWNASEVGRTTFAGRLMAASDGTLWRVHPRPVGQDEQSVVSWSADAGATWSPELPLHEPMPDDPFPVVGDLGAGMVLAAYYENKNPQTPMELWSRVVAKDKALNASVLDRNAILPPRQHGAVTRSGFFVDVNSGAGGVALAWVSQDAEKRTTKLVILRAGESTASESGATEPTN